MSASKLIKPSVEIKESFLEALTEYHEEGRFEYIKHFELEQDFEDFVNQLNDGKPYKAESFADWVELVPQTVLWFVKEDFYIGSLTIRHRLNWHLEKWGGHVTFTIRPSMRGKGFGKKILQKGIPYIAYFGIDKALFTTPADNESAGQVIEFCGGTFEDETPATEQFPAQKRYWLDCT